MSQKEMETQFRQFMARYEKKASKADNQFQQAYFTATATGKASDYKTFSQRSLALNKLYANKQDFARLRKFTESGLIKHPLLKRQLQIVCHHYLVHQADKKKIKAIINLETKIERTFNTFRAAVNGKKLTDNQVNDMLERSTDSRQLEQVWSASKEVGALVSKDILRLVMLRNDVARELGFRNYHEMQLMLNDQDPHDIERLFDELDALLRQPFRKLKTRIDAALTKRYQIARNELMPWHYQDRFFQEEPKIFNLDLDAWYKDRDLLAIARQYYAGIGLPIDTIVQRSDLFERKGKYQHAYCIDVDRKGDVRVMMSVTPKLSWMSTSLHEFGHAVNFKYMDRSLPWVLRNVDTFVTEAIAALFEVEVYRPDWMRKMLGLSAAEVERIGDRSWEYVKMNKLVFSRWSQVMYRFEKSLYEDPGQDLNALWWKLVEKYQLLKRPQGRAGHPDWATKIHIASVPVYYHNYQLGHLLSSQLYHHICQQVIRASSKGPVSLLGDKRVGKYLVNHIFKPGMKFHWKDLIRRATKEPLTVKYFAQQYINQ